MSTTTARVGLDIGGTATRIALVADTDVVDAVTISTPASHTTAVTELRTAIGSLLQRAARPITGIGVGASGPVDRDGVIRNEDTLLALTGIDLPSELGGAFGVPVVVDNDAVTAALAEYRVGAGIGAAAMLLLTLGTGVGVAVVRNGAILRGGDGLHAEAGHISVPNGPAPCYCGRATCLEQTASRSGLQRRARTVTGVSDLQALQRSATTDAAARRVLEDYGTRVGEGIIELATQYRPDRVVLGGSAATLLPDFADAMQQTVSAMTSAPVPEITGTALDDLGGAIGAALLIGPEGQS